MFEGTVAALLFSRYHPMCELHGLYFVGLCIFSWPALPEASGLTAAF
jgi:hypothetical protein